MPQENGTELTRSSGNVFLDLGFPGLKRAQAAKTLRVPPSRFSDLLRGRVDLFTTDALIDMLARLGVHVRLVLKAPRRRLKVAQLLFIPPR